MKRMTFGDLDLSVIDPHERDTRYIYDEIFEAEIYRHPNMRLPSTPTLVDVGANIGLFALWAHRAHQPKTIHCYEASPQTFAYLQDNVARLIDTTSTTVHTVNKAVARKAGESLVLHQAPFISGLSTLLKPAQIPWVQKLTDSNEIITHEVTTTTLSAEIASKRIPVIDLLKIDVEGYFMEVLCGIGPADFARIGNVVIEIDYAAETGASDDDVARLLQANGFKTECKDLTFYAWRA